MPTVKRISILRWLVAAALLAGVLFFADVHGTIAALAGISAAWLAVLVATSLLLLFISAAKWQRCTAALGEPHPLGELAQSYLAGYLINFALPSFVGGDVLRGALLARNAKAETAIVATALDRYLTLLAVIALAVCCLPVAAGLTRETEVGVLALAAAMALVTAALFVWGRADQPEYAAQSAPARMLQRLRSALAAARARPRYLAQAFALAAAYQCAMVVNVYTAALAVGWRGVSWSDLFVTLPVMFTLSSAPISPAALGLQEAVFLYFLEAVGALPSQALAVSVVMRAKALLLALGGWGALVLSTRPREADSRTRR
jgi:uncharacterized membrane protein YbhN (UPF0104 family)